MDLDRDVLLLYIHFRDRKVHCLAHFVQRNLLQEDQGQERHEQSDPRLPDLRVYESDLVQSEHRPVHHAPHMSLCDKSQAAGRSGLGELKNVLCNPARRRMPCQHFPIRFQAAPFLPSIQKKAIQFKFLRRPSNQPR